MRGGDARVVFWCLLNTTSYAEAVFAAVQLGHNIGTAVVTGDLAGFHCGIDTAPVDRYESVARIEDLEVLCDALYVRYPSKPYALSLLVLFLCGKEYDSSGPAPFPTRLRRGQRS